MRRNKSFKTSYIVFTVFGLIITLLLSFTTSSLTSSTPLEEVSIEDAITNELGYTFTGQAAYDWAGNYISTIGDINQDSYDDFLISAMKGNGSTGEVYLIYGRSNDQWNNMNLMDADASFVGEEVGSSTGQWLAAIGDINQDTYPDFAIAAPRNNESGNWAGQTYIIFGSDSSQWTKDYSLSQVNASYLGEVSFDYSGHGLAGLGDINGDGIDDFAISAEGSDENALDAGQVYIIFGRSSNTWTMDTSLAQANASLVGNETNLLLGADLAGVGDVNKDGVDDFIMGAYRVVNTKRYRYAYLVFGKEQGWGMGSSIETANVTFVLEEVPEVTMWPISGDFISGVNDVNHDGYDDILIGGIRSDQGGIDAGSGYLFLGRATASWQNQYLKENADVIFTGESADGWAGWSVGSAGDVNKDTYDDLLIGAVNLFNPSSEGKTYLILGKESWTTSSSLSNADYIYTQKNVGDGLGFHVAGIGDVNNDDQDDIAIGAIFNDQNGPDAGIVYMSLNYFISEPTTTTTTATTTDITTTTTPPTTEDPTDNGTSFLATPVSLVACLIILISLRKKSKEN